MIPRLQTGTSFKGAALYYLHDKRADGEAERRTAGRVGWTYAINTLENDPHHVIREMQRTAYAQQYLKELAGNRGDGRPTHKTVTTVALSWHPDQTVSREEMIAAAQSFLRHMGWQDHQALFLSHTDTKHPHMHIILNRIHPETGMTLDDRWSRQRAQQWALDYEHAEGKIYCARRLERGRRPASKHYGQWRVERAVADDPPHAGATRTEAAHAWKTLKQEQRHERQAFWKETSRLRKEVRAAVRELVREEFAPAWRAYAQYRRSLEGAEEKGAAPLSAEVRAELTGRRAAITARQRERANALLAPALKRLSEDRQQDYHEVLARHRDQRAELRSNPAAARLLGAKDAKAASRPLSASVYLRFGQQNAPRPTGTDWHARFSEAAREVAARKRVIQRHADQESVAPRKTTRRKRGEDGQNTGIRWQFSRTLMRRMLSAGRAHTRTARTTRRAEGRDKKSDTAWQSARVWRSAAALRAVHGAARRALTSKLRAEAAQARASALALLAAEFATKIADAKRNTPRRQLSARLEALRNEQQAAIRALTQRVAAQAGQTRKTQVATLNDRQKEERAAGYREAASEITRRSAGSPDRPRKHERDRRRNPRPRTLH